MKPNAMTAPRGFAGTIQGATLHDLIQMECLTMSTRAVRIERGGRSGRIFFAGGQIIHAETAELNGELALYELLGWSGGQFFFEEGVRPIEDTISRDWHGLLLEAAHYLDEKIAAAQSVHTANAMTAIPLPKMPIEEVFRDSEVLQAVHFSEDGTLLHARADDADTMQASFAYIEQLTRLIGTSLGMEGLREIQITSAEKKALCVISDTETTALITTTKANNNALITKLS